MSFFPTSHFVWCQRSTKLQRSALYFLVSVLESDWKPSAFWYFWRCFLFSVGLVCDFYTEEEVPYYPCVNQYWVSCHFTRYKSKTSLYILNLFDFETNFLTTNMKLSFFQLTSDIHLDLELLSALFYFSTLYAHS